MESLSYEEIAFESVLLDRKGAIVQRRDGRTRVLKADLGNGVALEIVAIPGGSFQMGSPHGQGYSDETPRHLVSLPPFAIGRFPVTQEQWKQVMGKAPRGRFSGARLPVENVTWKEAQEFCRRLSRITGRRYGFPSEAQWEYACRAGAASPFSTGDTITTDYANYVGSYIYAEEPPGPYRHVTTPVDSFPANAFGVNDMPGNVWEFCADRWHPDYSGAPFNGEAWEWGGEAGCRVARGGSWHEPPVNCRCATRLRVAENDRDDYYGFRVALTADAFPG